MNKNIYIILDVIYLVAMALLIIFGDVIKSWWDLLIGFVGGLTVYELANFFRNDKRGKRNLR